MGTLRRRFHDGLRRSALVLHPVRKERDMKKLLLVIITAAISTAATASPKHLLTIAHCEGPLMLAHTIIVGNCSFTGFPAEKVHAQCKEDDLCEVTGRGWWNRDGMLIIEHVDAVEKEALGD
jgi:hypothetical protein